MPELDQVEKRKDAGFVSRRPSSYDERIKKEEEELEKLEKEARGEVEETPETDDEEKTEAEAEVKEETKEELKGEEKTYKKRYGDLRRHQQKVEKELKDEIEALKKHVESGGKGVALPKSDEDIEAWMKKYPDVAGIVTSLVAKETEKRVKNFGVDLDGLKQDQAKSKQEKAISAIKKAHPDFDDLQDDDAFHDWMEEQPDAFQSAVYDNPDNPGPVIRVIDLYKADTSGITPKKKSEKEAATSVKGGKRTNPDDGASKGKIKESDVAKLSMRDYEEREEEINKAIREGNFIYDVSGGAR